jgi:hypothetical protein
MLFVLSVLFKEILPRRGNVCHDLYPRPWTFGAHSSTMCLLPPSWAILVALEYI